MKQDLGWGGDRVGKSCERSAALIWRLDGLIMHSLILSENSYRVPTALLESGNPAET